MEIGSYYIKNKESKEITKVQFTASKYVHIKNLTFLSIIKSFIDDMKYFFYKRDIAINDNEINDKIRNVLVNVYDEYNESSINNKSRLIDYKKEIFEETEVPNYIM